MMSEELFTRPEREPDLKFCQEFGIIDVTFNVWLEDREEGLFKFVPLNPDGSSRLENEGQVSMFKICGGSAYFKHVTFQEFCEIIIHHDATFNMLYDFIATLDIEESIEGDYE